MIDNSLCGGLFSKTRQTVLALLYGQSDTSFYTRQILDALKIGRGTVQRELKNLTDVGIITREVQGRQVYYRANEKCPIFSELKNIMRKTGHERSAVSYPLTVSRQPAPLPIISESKVVFSPPGSPHLKRGDKGGSRSKIAVPKHKLADFCRRNYIRRLSLFGSVLREDFRADSDVDVLVEFDPDHFPGFFKLGDMEEELSTLFDGRKVDIRTAEDLSRYFRQRVLQEAEVQYAAP
jgi:predicted nucleotidyltransferase/DNA-binding transcriptional ArsR family regulator